MRERERERERERKRKSFVYLSNIFFLYRDIHKILQVPGTCQRVGRGVYTEVGASQQKHENQGKHQLTSIYKMYR